MLTLPGGVLLKYSDDLYYQSSNFQIFMMVAGVIGITIFAAVILNFCSSTREQKNLHKKKENVCSLKTVA